MNLTETWQQEILSTTAELQNQKLVHDGIDLREAVTKWSKDDQHGAGHSANVYTGVLALCQKEGIVVDEQSDTRSQEVAIIHDLARFLPGFNYRTGLPIANWNEIKVPHHAMISASLILRLFGDKQMAYDVAYHDLTMAKLSPENKAKQISRLSPIGKVFHDADKLFGLGYSEDPAELAAMVIVRNRLGAFKEDGWYLLRGDLTDADRLSQEYGKRYFSDRLSTIGSEVLGIECLTESGRQIAQEREEAFINSVAAEQYGAEYDQTQRAVDWWQRNCRRGLKVELVGKNIEPTELSPTKITSAINNAFNYNLRLVGKYSTPARGAMLKLSFGDQERLIDPSIARFESKSGFLFAVNKALAIWRRK